LHSAHVAAAWLGHSKLVANKHYRQVTDTDFANAISPASEPSSDAEQKTAQKAAQHAHAESGGNSQAPKAAQQKAPVLLGSAMNRETLQPGAMGVTGFEHPAESSGNIGDDQQSGAECGALDAQARPIDPRLASIVRIWPELPEPIKVGILAMIRGAG